MKTFNEFFTEAHKKRQRVVDGSTDSLAGYASGGDNIYKKIDGPTLSASITTATKGITDKNKLMQAAKKVLASVGVKSDTIKILDVDTSKQDHIWSFMYTTYS